MLNPITASKLKSNIGVHVIVYHDVGKVVISFCDHEKMENVIDAIKDKALVESVRKAYEMFIYQSSLFYSSCCEIRELLDKSISVNGTGEMISSIINNKITEVKRLLGIEPNTSFLCLLFDYCLDPENKSRNVEIGRLKQFMVGIEKMIDTENHLDNKYYLPTPTSKNKIIVFEGMDGSGKQTQSTKTAEELNYKWESFPRYESGTGKIIREYLVNKDLTQRDMSKLEEVKLDSMLYVADRANWRMNDYNPSPGYVFDRYYTSNILYQTQLLNDEDLKLYIDWLEDLELKEFRIPKPDIVFCLVADPQVTMSNIEKRGRVIDKFENQEVQLRIYNNANRISKILGWKLINVVNEEGSMRSIEEVHEEIMKYIL